MLQPARAREGFNGKAIRVSVAAEAELQAILFTRDGPILFDGATHGPPSQPGGLQERRQPALDDHAGSEISLLDRPGRPS
jgi:hypothetical protein